ncbi:MAG: hypothetical protein RR827_03930 [Oscillospiraceae bacterium]
MESIAKFIGILCMASFIMSILMNFGKFEATEKIIRFVISIFIIVTIFKPYSFGDTFNSFEFAPISWEKPLIDQSKVNDLVIEKTKENLAELVKIRLSQKNISYISLNLHILNQDGSLSIDQIEIMGCDESQKVEIKSCLEDIITENTEIVLGD